MGPQLTIVGNADEPGRLVVSGEVDLCTAPDLHDTLCRAVDTAIGEFRAVITVDLSSVTFIDARGLNVLAVSEAYACVRGIRMLFADVPVSIVRLLRIVRLSVDGMDGHDVPLP
jgi:anti-anti-sigma factor